MKKRSGPVLVVQAKVKEVIKKNKMNCASDVMNGLSGIVESYIQKAAERARSNGRKTVRAADL